jgi:nucleotide-binding universal stress UspA family protein
MRNIKKIMAAVDMSDYTCSILETAERMAKELKCELLIANIFNPGNVDTVKLIEQFEHEFEDLPHDVKTQNYLDKLKNEKSKELDAMINQMKINDISTKKLFRTGTPYKELVALVKEENVDLVIMGPKGRTNFAHVVFGSTAEKRFRHCPVSIMSVREMDNEHLRACMLIEEEKE